MPTKVVHYRRFEPVVSAWSKGSLRTLLHKALHTKTESGGDYVNDWQARKFSVPGDVDLIRFMHSILISDDSIFGTLCLFMPDDWAAVLKQMDEGTGHDHKSLDDTIKAVEIAERPPLAGEDYLRGIAYWLVINDHVFVVQHTSVQTKAFEEYFAQLLINAGVIDEEDKFALRSEFDKAKMGGDLDDISAVEIGGVLNRGDTLPSVAAQSALKQSIDEKISMQEVEEQKTIGRKVTAFERAKDVLRAVFGDPNAESIISSIPADAELEVDVRFGYKTRSRKLSRQALHDIARAARNLPDGEVVAIGKGGKQIGDDLRLSLNMPFKLIHDKGTLLVLEDARTQLLRVYQRFVEDGKIET